MAPLKVPGPWILNNLKLLATGYSLTVAVDNSIFTLALATITFLTLTENGLQMIVMSGTHQGRLQRAGMIRRSKSHQPIKFILVNGMSMAQLAPGLKQMVLVDGSVKMVAKKVDGTI